ncbi:MAG: ATP-binding protein [Phenylobacterium sp.]
MKISLVPDHLPRNRPALGLAVGAAVFVVAVLLRWRLGGLAEGLGPIALLPAILLAGLFGGIWVGSIVAGVCIAVGWVWFFPPYGTLTLSARHVVTMAMLLVTAALELYVVAVLNRAIDNLSVARERSNTLFRELQHRVANNLQFVAALLRLRKKTLDRDSPGAFALGAAQARLDMLSRVHRRLNSPIAADQPAGPYLEALCADLIKASDLPDVRLEVTAEPIILGLEALMSVSLIVAELVTNSLKHAFPDGGEARISIGLRATGQQIVLNVADNGVGLPDGFARGKSGSLGQGILQSLVRQLRGAIAFEAGPGTTARISFPG